MNGRLRGKKAEQFLKPLNKQTNPAPFQTHRHYSLGLFATPQPQQREPGTKVVLPNTAGAALALDPSDAGNALACILHARLAQRLCGVRGIQRIIILEDSAPFLVVVANRLERHRLEVVGLLAVAVEPQPADNVHVLLLPLNKTKKKTQS